MGQQYQDTISSFAASPQAMEPQQATQTAGNNTLGKSMEQSPMHDGFGTRSGMYDNGMDVSAQPAPAAPPPQPQNQPASAGINPSWAQQARKRGGRAKRADGGPLAAFASGPISPLMMTGDTLAKLPQSAIPATNVPAQVQAPASVPVPVPVPPQMPAIPQSSDPYESYLNNLYMQDFNRAPDPGGMSYWKDILSSKKATPEQVAQQFLGSDEFRNRSAMAQDNALMPGVIADQPGTMDPFVAGYNARMANAQKLYGGIAQQNAVQNTADQVEYQKQLEAVQAANQQRLAAAQQAKAERQAREAEAARQQQLMMMLMMMSRR